MMLSRLSSCFLGCWPAKAKTSHSSSLLAKCPTKERRALCGIDLRVAWRRRKDALSRSSKSLTLPAPGIATPGRVNFLGGLIPVAIMLSSAFAKWLAPWFLTMRTTMPCELFYVLLEVCHRPAVDSDRLEMSEPVPAS